MQAWGSALVLCCVKGVVSSLAWAASQDSWNKKTPRALKAEFIFGTSSIIIRAMPQSLSNQTCDYALQRACFLSVRFASWIRPATLSASFRSTIPAESYESAAIDRHGAHVGDFNEL
jgi:hypothetical protein